MSEPTTAVPYVPELAGSTTVPNPTDYANKMDALRRPATCAGFCAAFRSLIGRDPTPQDIWDAAIQQYKSRHGVLR